jgi:signal transduction histidine kinase
MAPEWSLLSPAEAWPLHEVVRDVQTVEVSNLQTRFRGQVIGREETTPRQAGLQPLRDEAVKGVAGLLILGLNPRLTLDDGYRDFHSVVGGTVSAKVADAHARHRERDRLERLAELDQAKTEFLANVSHEFRTPLTLMLGPLEDLETDVEALPAAARDAIALIRRNAHRLLRLVGTMRRLLSDRGRALAGALRPH